MMAVPGAVPVSPSGTPVASPEIFLWPLCGAYTGLRADLCCVVKEVL